MVSKISLALALFLSTNYQSTAAPTAAPTAATESQERRLTVSGSGSAKVAAANMFINFEMMVTDEVVPEAMKKFAAKLRLLEKTTTSLDVKNVKIERGSTRIGMKRTDPYSGMNDDKAPDYEVAERIRLRIDDIGQLDAAGRINAAAAILDTLGQSGFIRRPGRYYDAFGRFVTGTEDLDPSEVDLVAFDVADAAALEAEASKKAVADARRRATSLAELNGVKTGKILRIHAEPAKKKWQRGNVDCTCTVEVQIDFEIVD